MTARTINVSIFHAWLTDGAELAVLDLRPAEDFGHGEPLFATNLPASRVEAEIGRYIPRRAVRTVLADGGDGTATALAARLAAAGWDNLYALEGGIPAWLAQRAETLPTFDTPGVIFSEAVRARESTPVMYVERLADLRRRRADVIVLDSRTVPEYAAGHIPGAVSLPGAELLYRFADLVPSPETEVVVSCAGLPRAILGAQTLIDAGVPNRVSYLHDGTAAWRRAGLDLEAGATRVYRTASRAAVAFAEQHLASLRAARTVPEIDLDTAAAWAADPQRTTYVLDVRTPEEYADGHLEGSLSAEGGQLFGVSHRTIAVRGARVVLVDDSSGIRAATTAHWLARRGFEIAVLRYDFAGAQLGAVA